jgi:hypothetical protein
MPEPPLVAVVVDVNGEPVTVVVIWSTSWWSASMSGLWALPLPGALLHFTPGAEAATLPHEQGGFNVADVRERTVESCSWQL